MNESTIKFNSVTALAKHIGISRKTLYERAKRDSIELNGVYTQDQLDSLAVKGAKSVTDTKNDTLKQSDTQSNETVENVLRDQISEMVHDKEKLYAELTMKNNQIKELNKQVDQAQQLQLMAEQRLSEGHQLRLDTEEIVSDLKENQEKKRGFLSRIFGG